LKVILIGPLTCDMIVKDGSNYKTTGGPVFYQSGVFKSLNIDVDAVITLSANDQNLITPFPDSVNITPIFTVDTMQFQNIYPDFDPNHRIQKAIIPENPINYKLISQIDFASGDAILLGPLSPYDLPLKTFKYLFQFDVPLYLGGQGYLRYLNNDKITLMPWKDYKDYLKYVECLFIDENEAKIILGGNYSNLRNVSIELAACGPKEIVITCGSKGALIYSKVEDLFYEIPAIAPDMIKDPTGLGDTFMAAYVAKKFETDDIEKCGRFAALLSSMKLEKKGFFNYQLGEIQDRLRKINFEI